MDPAVKRLKAALEAIRDIAANALSQVGQSKGERSLRWKCKACQYLLCIFVRHVYCASRCRFVWRRFLDLRVVIYLGIDEKFIEHFELAQKGLWN